MKEGEYPGLYETEFAITDDPMISILIPNKDHLVDLQTFFFGSERNHNDTPDDGRLTRALWSVTCLYRQRQSETTAGDREKHDRPLQKSN